MKKTFNKLKLPSNKKFGYFFTFVFLVLSIYTYYLNFIILPSILITLSFFLLLVSFYKPALLSPLNKYWMFVGFFLSKIISPIVIGAIFFGLFLPIGMFSRILGRDELKLKLKKKNTYWVVRSQSDNNEFSFKKQY